MGLEYPKWLYSATDPPVVVTSAAQALTLPPSYGASPVAAAGIAVPDGSPVIVSTPLAPLVVAQYSSGLVASVATAPPPPVRTTVPAAKPVTF